MFKISFFTFLVSFSAMALTTERPNHAIEIGTPCVCQEQKAVVTESAMCVSFCSNKEDVVPTLYSMVTLKDGVAMNPDFATGGSFGNLNGWCSKEIADGKEVPVCQIVFTELASQKEILMDVCPGTNSFKVPVTELAQGKNYSFYIQETTSGAMTKAQTLNY